MHARPALRARRRLLSRDARKPLFVRAPPDRALRLARCAPRARRLARPRRPGRDRAERARGRAPRARGRARAPCGRGRRTSCPAVGDERQERERCSRWAWSRTAPGGRARLTAVAGPARRADQRGAARRRGAVGRRDPGAARARTMSAGVLLEVGRIVGPPTPVFRDPARVDELASSVRAVGLRCPLVVRPLDVGTFELIDGHSPPVDALGWREVRAVLLELDDRAAPHAQLRAADHEPARGGAAGPLPPRPRRPADDDRRRARPPDRLGAGAPRALVSRGRARRRTSVELR